MLGASNKEIVNVRCLGLAFGTLLPAIQRLLDRRVSGRTVRCGEESFLTLAMVNFVAHVVRPCVGFIS